MNCKENQMEKMGREDEQSEGEENDEQNVNQMN